MQFLKYLVCSYLAETHPEAVRQELADEISPVPISARAEDSFKKYYKKIRKDRPKLPGHVYHLTGMHAGKLCDHRRPDVLQCRS